MTEDIRHPARRAAPTVARAGAAGRAVLALRGHRGLRCRAHAHAARRACSKTPTSAAPGSRRVVRRARGYLLAVYVFSLEHQGLTAEIDEFFVRAAASRPRARAPACWPPPKAQFRVEGCTNVVAAARAASNEAARALLSAATASTIAPGYELVSKNAVSETCACTTSTSPTRTTPPGRCAPGCCCASSAIPFREVPGALRRHREPRRVPRLLAHRQGALPGRRRDHRLGFAGHHRVRGRASCRCVAGRSRGARLGALRRGGDAFRVLRRCATPARMNCGIRVQLQVHRRRRCKRDLARLEAAVGRRHRPLRRPVPHRHALLRGRCVLRAGGVPHPDLRSADRRRRAPLCRAAAGAAVDAGAGTRPRWPKPGATRSTRPRRAPPGPGPPTCAQSS